MIKVNRIDVNTFLVQFQVMRQETIYEILRTCRNDDARNWQDNFKKEIIGTIVLTDYNNHTYRVDDVDFASSPSSTFMQKGVEVSYADYYKNKYNLEIRDRKQPMLCSNPKPADVRAGRTQIIFLVPELSRATGLTDRMRANFQMMRGMADHTQMDPTKRTARLMDFTRRLHQTPDSMNRMKSFNTDIETQLVSFNGRALKQEVMKFGNGAE
jgi:aubergine